MRRFPTLYRYWATIHFVVGRAAFFPILGAVSIRAALAGANAKLEPKERVFAAQGHAHWGCRLYVKLLDRIKLVHSRWIAKERLHTDGPLIIVANHPSYLDAFFFLAELPQLDCIVSARYKKEPFLRWIVASADYQLNDGGRSVLDACIQRLHDGRTLVLFPEGTRSPEGEMGEFHRGAAHIALRSGCPILPVAIHCKNPEQMRDLHWNTPYEEPGEFVFEVLSPIDPRDFMDEDQSMAINARKLTSALSETFTKRLASAKF